MNVCISLDLEPDHAGRAPVSYEGWEPARLDALCGLLADHGASLTVFVVAESLAAQPKAVQRLADGGAEFHLHSYSHDLAQPDSADEIEKGSAAFTAFFGRAPEGYRAPEGRISPQGWQRLDAAGFAFDSSIFPSFWPRPRYLQYQPAPFRPTGCKLVELPISTLTPMRLIVSLSWMKLLGWPVYQRLLSGPLPEPLVFDMHLHDLWRLPAFDRLTGPWKAIYSRNADQGLSMLESFLGLLKTRGASFSTIGAVARQATC
jgi:peptidoglycan/xylan/chitin deacetylase (PgdA/CDA1 family)